jgi:iron complex outermembrane receptor protein
VSFRRVLSARAVSWCLVLAAASVSAPALAQPGAVTPPVPLNHPDPPYPQAEIEHPREVTVILNITVEKDGTVSEPEVHQTAGSAFDEVALAAVRTWTFTPAQKAGKPVRARVQAMFHFDPPAVQGATGASPPTNAGPTPPYVHPPPRAPTPPPPAPAPAAPPAPAPAPTPPPAAPAPASPPVIQLKALEVEAVGHKDRDSGAAAEYHIPLKELAYVPAKNASGRLGLAPGILLSNEGGEGHAEQVFLRGFDTHEGSEIEFTVDGVPINDSGNPHGTGYADTHFIIPELISSLRVLESPFDPAQGNYAVAGSADFHLGLAQRGLTVKLTAGTFGTERMLAMWGPAGMSEGTFGAVELYHTSGFGQNRAAERATGIAQYEGHFGDHGIFRITGTAYGTSFQSAGVVRQDDVKSVGFYGTEDPRQGGSSSRFSVAGSIDSKVGDADFHVQLFAIHRTMRLLENFTGFLEDTQNPLNTLHGQRGDLSDIYFDGTTVGARASATYSGKVFGLKQSIELGLYARGDITHGTQQRILASDSNTLVPYQTDQDLSSNLGDIALYANADLRLTKWLSLRGGFRAELFEFDVQNNCAVTGDPIDHPQPSATPDVSCATQNSDGSYREPSQRTTTGTPAVLPRGTLVVGPFSGFSLSVSAGRGARTIDPSNVSQGNLTPFVSLTAYEAGVSYARLFDSVSVTAKSVFFSTHVGQDLAFDPNEVTYALSSGATRTGWAGSGRVTGSFYDLAANLTFVRGTYDGTGLLIPYVPNLVLRSDNALFHDLPIPRLGGKPFRGVLAAGASYLGPRPLPFGQFSDPVFLLDASAAIDWRPFELSLVMTNVLGSQYHVGDYNYASYFPHNNLPSFPTLVPARAFAAGAPRQVLVSLSGTVGE